MILHHVIYDAINHFLFVCPNNSAYHGLRISWIDSFLNSEHSGLPTEKQIRDRSGRKKNHRSAEIHRHHDNGHEDGDDADEGDEGDEGDDDEIPQGDLD